MGQGKPCSWDTPGKGMIVAVAGGISLCGQTGVAHDHPGILRNVGTEQMGRARALINVQLPPCVVGDPRCVRPTGLALLGEHAQEPCLLPATQAAAVVHQAKETAHQASTSLSTGSLT